MPEENGEHPAPSIAEAVEQVEAVQQVAAQVASDTLDPIWNKLNELESRDTSRAEEHQAFSMKLDELSSNVNEVLERLKSNPTETITEPATEVASDAVEVVEEPVTTEEPTHKPRRIFL